MDAIVYTRNDDEYDLIKTTLENEAYDFIERPYGKERLEQSIRDGIERCPNRNRWVFRSDCYERQEENGRKARRKAFGQTDHLRIFGRDSRKLLEIQEKEDRNDEEADEICGHSGSSYGTWRLQRSAGGREVLI